jgi:hypothetical protein
LPLACKARATAHDDGRLCPSACAGWVESCGVEARSCVDGCWRSREGATREGCSDEHTAYLTCLTRAKAFCEPPPAPRVAFSYETPGRECETEFARYARCSEPCREEGVLRSGNRELSLDGRARVVMAEQVTAGCGPVPPKIPRMAPPGSRCEAARVCTGFRCQCQGSPVASVARACVDGACADAEAACRLVPLAVGHDVCPGRKDAKER